LNNRDYVINWFAKKMNITKEKVVEQINSNYFDLKWMDSFDFINFLADIEDDLGIELDNSEFQDRRFSTISGLINILNERYTDD